MVREGYVLIHPNRRSASAKATRFIVALLLVISAALLAIVTIGGWDKLQSAKVLQIAWVVLYLLFAFLVLRWNRGVLPLLCALAIILLIFAAIAGPQWFSRDKPGFSDPTLDEGFLGLITLIIIPVQVLLIAFGARGFTQAWNVEEEVPVDQAQGYRPSGRGTEPAGGPAAA
jgi:hypothetical protein